MSQVWRRQATAALCAPQLRPRLPLPRGQGPQLAAAPTCSFPPLELSFFRHYATFHSFFQAYTHSLDFQLKQSVASIDGHFVFFRH